MAGTNNSMSAKRTKQPIGPLQALWILSLLGTAVVMLQCAFWVSSTGEMYFAIQGVALTFAMLWVVGFALEPSWRANVHRFFPRQRVAATLRLTWIGLTGAALLVLVATSTFVHGNVAMNWFGLLSTSVDVRSGRVTLAVEPNSNKAPWNVPTHFEWVGHMASTCPAPREWLGWGVQGARTLGTGSHAVYLPDWCLAAILAGLHGFAIRGMVRRIRQRRDGLCLVCSYDLTGNVSGRCPECGTVIPAPVAVVDERCG